MSLFGTCDCGKPLGMYFPTLCRVCSGLSLVALDLRPDDDEPDDDDDEEG